MPGRPRPLRTAAGTAPGRSADTVGPGRLSGDAFSPLVPLVIGLLFISLSAAVTPHSLRHVVLPTQALVAVLVIIVRPLVAALVGKGIGGAAKILPASFVVIVATVTLYGLTAHPVARRPAVLRPARRTTSTPSPR